MKAQVELTVGDAVAAPTYTEVFVLDVEYMHGDADGETHEIFRYSLHDPAQMADLKRDIAAIHHIEDGDLDDEDMLEQYFKSQGYENYEQEASDFRDKFWQGDITCEGNAAALAGIDLFFYDSQGVKRHAGATVNGIDV